MYSNCSCRSFLFTFNGNGLVTLRISWLETYMEQYKLATFLNFVISQISTKCLLFLKMILAALR